MLAGVSQSLVLDALWSCGITDPGLTDEETGASSPQGWAGSWGTVDTNSGRSDPRRSPPGSPAFWSPLQDSHPLALPPLPGGLELGSGSLVTTPTFLREELSGSCRTELMRVLPAWGVLTGFQLLWPLEFIREKMGGGPLVLRLSCYLKQPRSCSPTGGLPGSKMDFSGFCQSL